MKPNLHLFLTLSACLAFTPLLKAQCAVGQPAYVTLSPGANPLIHELEDGVTPNSIQVTSTPAAGAVIQNLGKGSREMTFADDVNNDGLVDIVYVWRVSAGNSRSEIRTYLNVGENEFDEPLISTILRPGETITNAPAGVSNEESAFLADVNGDGNLDYVHADQNVTNNNLELVTYFGDGTGNFSQTEVGSEIAQQNFNEAGETANENFYMADVTGDGIVDYVGFRQDDIYIWAGDNTGTFTYVPGATSNTPSATLPAGGTSDRDFSGVSNAESNAFVDVNNDGRLDYVHVTEFDGNGNAAILAYINNGASGFSTGPVITTYNQSTGSSFPDGDSGKFAGTTSSEYFQFFDFNEDGNQDYVIFNNGTFAYYAGDGTGGFSTSPDFEVTDNTIETGISGSKFTFVGCGFKKIDPLPVELTSFSATAQGDAVQLDWTTISETNNAGFEVQRSYSGSDWNTVSFVEGNGTTASLQSYDYLDTDVLGGSIYYRLKQVDFDGKAEYSNVVVVNFQSLTRRVAVYPNPVTDLLNVQGMSGTATLYSITGQQVRTFNLEGIDNQLDLSSLESGHYLLTIRTKDGAVVNHKVVK